MFNDTFNDDMINIVLRQAGADSIKTHLAHINIVTFQIAPDVKVTYVYEIKENGEIYVERTSPYPMLLGRMFDESALIEIIKNDVASFKNAYNSKNYDAYLQLVKSHIRFQLAAEDLFMKHNVDADDLDDLHSTYERLHQQLEEVKSRSEKIELEK
ncbi:hypothetical protein HMPREF1635_06735 [Clostridiales bacterium S5-A14a]|nr:hypothetical protein HMPREF1635_06735 [Clostridiales bacterium S5-A14a]